MSSKIVSLKGTLVFTLLSKYFPSKKEPTSCFLLIQYFLLKISIVTKCYSAIVKNNSFENRLRRLHTIWIKNSGPLFSYLRHLNAPFVSLFGSASLNQFYHWWLGAGVNIKGIYHESNRKRCLDKVGCIA